MLKIIRVAVVALSLAVAGLSAQPAAAPKDTSTRAKATPQNAAAFVGEWELSGEGTHGPASFTLSIKSKDKALATELKKGETAQTVTEVSLVGSKLELAGFTFQPRQAQRLRRYVHPQPGCPVLGMPCICGREP